jgi:outer membrane protein OmpA-like peptidoglycan-associated protein
MTSALITLSAAQEALANTRYYAAPIGEPTVELNLDVIDGYSDVTAEPGNAAPIRLNPDYASSSVAEPTPVSEPAQPRATITLKPTRAMLEKQRQAHESAQVPVALPETTATVTTTTTTKPTPTVFALPSSSDSLITETHNKTASEIEMETIAAPKKLSRTRSSTTFSRADAPGIADVKIMAPRSLPPLEQAHRTSELPTAATPKYTYETPRVDSSPVQMPEIETIKSSSKYEPVSKPIAKPAYKPVTESSSKPIAETVATTRPAVNDVPAYDMPPIEEVTIVKETARIEAPEQPAPSRPIAQPTPKATPPRPSFFDVIERSVDRLAGDVRSDIASPADAQASYTPEQGYAPIPNAALFDPRKKPESSDADTKRIAEAAVTAHEAKPEPTPAPVAKKADTIPPQKNENIIVEVTQPANTPQKTSAPMTAEPMPDTDPEMTANVKTPVSDFDADMAPAIETAPYNIQEPQQPQLPKINTVSEPMLPRRAVNPEAREDSYTEETTKMNIDSYEPQKPAPAAVSTPTPPPVSSDRASTLPIIKEDKTTTSKATTQQTKPAPQISWNEAPAYDKPVAFKIDPAQETPVKPAFEPSDERETPSKPVIKPEVIKLNKNAKVPAKTHASRPSDGPSLTIEDEEQAHQSRITEENNRIEPAARTITSSRQTARVKTTDTAEKTRQPSIDQNQSLIFDGASSDLKPELQQNLDSMIAEMEADEDHRLQLRSYAASTDGSPSSARRVALGRAIKVRKYFMDQGIRSTRIDVRALGDETEQTPLNRLDMVLVR